MSSETNKTHSIARQLAREINPDELDSVAAGTTSCSSGAADDCDQLQQV